MTPTISTARLVLRGMTKPSNRNLLWLRDKDVTRYSEQRHVEHTLSTQLRYVNSFTGKSRLWAIWLASTGEHIGNISAPHDEPNNVSDVAIMIGEKSMWGKGFGAEAWNAVCEHLLHRDGGNIRKLEAGCMKANEPMLKIIRRSKFTQEGERLNHFLLQGAPISAVLFGRTK
jgi:[ribosomal protein S5]-alanine N-acetyltransferase